MDKQLEYAARIDRALRNAYEERKFGKSKQRLNLEETYEPLVGLLDKKRQKMKEQTTTNDEWKTALMKEEYIDDDDDDDDFI
jgi:hypothetical protein